MNKYIIGNIGYFLELWMILLYVETIWKQKICFTAFGMVLFVYNGIVLTCANLNLIPDFCLLTTYILLFGYLSVKYKGKWKELFVKICISLVLAWATEIVAGVIVVFVGRNIKAEVLRFILVNVISVLVAIIIKCLVNKRKQKNNEIEYKTLFKSILLCSVPVVTLTLVYLINHKLRIWYTILVVIFLSMLFWYFEKVRKSEYNMKQKELELSVNKVYGEVYEDVISDIRRKQHDYQNQLAAIYSSHKVARSKDELIMIQRQYCNKLQEDSKYEDILMLCQEPVLAGFLYYKCLFCNEKQVKVEYNIKVSEYTRDIFLYEIIEILGILIDNALEQELANDYEEKKIGLVLLENETKINMSVSNRVKDWSKIELDKMFKTGYSTKGSNRGLGLSRVKQICDKYGVEIEVLVEQNQEGRITFCVIL